MCIYRNACTHTNVHIRFTQSHTNAHIHTAIPTHTHAHTNTPTHTQTHTQTCTNSHAKMCRYRNVCTRTHHNVRIRFTQSHKPTQRTHTAIPTHTHTDRQTHTHTHKQTQTLPLTHTHTHVRIITKVSIWTWLMVSFYHHIKIDWHWRSFGLSENILLNAWGQPGMKTFSLIAYVNFDLWCWPLNRLESTAM